MSAEPTPRLEGLAELRPLREATPPRGALFLPDRETGEEVNLRAYTSRLIGDAQDAVRDLEQAWAAASVEAAERALMTAGARLSAVMERVRRVLR